MNRAAIALIENSGFVLCVWNRRYGGWGLPGGKVEEGESVAEALCRELREETGLRVAYAELIYTAPIVSSDSGRIVNVYRVEPVEYPRLDADYELEEGSRVAYRIREELLASSPFKAFYQQLFTHATEHST